MEFYEFYNLGLGEPIAVSSVHGHGTGDLLDEVLKELPEENEEDYGEDVIKVAVVRRESLFLILQAQQEMQLTRLSRSRRANSF